MASEVCEEGAVQTLRKSCQNPALTLNPSEHWVTTAARIFRNTQTNSNFCLHSHTYTQKNERMKDIPISKQKKVILVSVMYHHLLSSEKN